MKIDELAKLIGMIDNVRTRLPLHTAQKLKKEVEDHLVEHQLNATDTEFADEKEHFMECNQVERMRDYARRELESVTVIVNGIETLIKELT